MSHITLKGEDNLVEKQEVDLKANVVGSMTILGQFVKCVARLDIQPIYVIIDLINHKMVT